MSDNKTSSETEMANPRNLEDPELEAARGGLSLARLGTFADRVQRPTPLVGGFTSPIVRPTLGTVRPPGWLEDSVSVGVASITWTKDY